MSVPLVRLFSLDLLKTFVAVGRRGGITQAADDLCLTQSAVSRQVHALEQQVGTRLFVRKPRGVAFTDAGERLFRTADQAVRQLQELAAEMRGAGGARAVTITASTGITGLWLLPRLPRLQERHPALDVRLAALNALSDLQADGIDIALRYARDGSVPPGAQRLFDETLAAVAHPRVAQALQRGARCPLLEFDGSRPWLQWRRWFDESRWNDERRQVLHFNQYEQVIQAAVAGQGVAIGRIELLQSLIDGEQLALVDLGCTPQRSPYAVWLLLAEEEPPEAVRWVADWIGAEAAQVRGWCRPPAQHGAGA